MAITAEDIKKVNENLNKIDVKGKGYVQVNERIKGFRSVCPTGSVTSEIVSLENGVVTIKATVADENGCILATGYAQEKETSSYINKTSYIENCETSAVGRALGFAGFGIDASMASAEEVANAITQQNEMKKAQRMPIPDAVGVDEATTEPAAYAGQLISKADAERLNAMLKPNQRDYVLKMFAVDDISKLTVEQYFNTIKSLQAKKGKEE